MMLRKIENPADMPAVISSSKLLPGLGSVAGVKKISAISTAMAPKTEAEAASTKDLLDMVFPLVDVEHG